MKGMMGRVEVCVCVCGGGGGGGQGADYYCLYWDSKAHPLNPYSMSEPFGQATSHTTPFST